MGKQPKYLINATLLAIYDPRRPTCLPASPAILRSLSHSCFSHSTLLWVLLMHTQPFLHEGLCSFPLLSAMLSIIVSAATSGHPVLSPVSPSQLRHLPHSHHNLLSSCLLVIFRALFPLPHLLGFQLCAL